MRRHKGRGVSGLVKRLLVLRNSDKIYMCFLVFQVASYSPQNLADVNPMKQFRRLFAKPDQVYFYVLLTLHPSISLRISLGAQFCLIYLFHFCTCFGLPCVHHQEEITLPMRHWCLSFCMGGVWSASWIENPTSSPDATYTK